MAFNLSSVDIGLYFVCNTAVNTLLFSLMILPPFVLCLVCILALFFARDINSKIRLLLVNIFTAEICNWISYTIITVGVAESISDLTAIFVLTVFYEPDETRKAAAMKKLMQETVPGKLKYFEAKASTNESGWLCCSKMTWADLAAYQVLEWVVGANESAFDEFPSLKKLKASVEALPNIAKWLKERPQSPW